MHFGCFVLYTSVYHWTEQFVSATERCYVWINCIYRKYFFLEKEYQTIQFSRPYSSHNRRNTVSHTVIILFQMKVLFTIIFHQFLYIFVCASSWKGDFVPMFPAYFALLSQAFLLSCIFSSLITLTYSVMWGKYLHISFPVV